MPDAASNGPNEIEKHMASPNPSNGSAQLLVKLKGPVDSLEVRLYSKSMICIGVSELGPQGAGWRAIALPAELMIQGNGLYYYRVKSMQSGKLNQEPGIGSLMLLR
jgi:hypothetical protein